MNRYEYEREGGVQCNACGCGLSTRYAQRRKAVTSEREYRKVGEYNTRSIEWGLVNLCPHCAARYDAQALAQQKRRRLAILTIGVGVFGWIYLGPWGLLGGLLTILIGSFYQPIRNFCKKLCQRKKIEYLPPERGNS